MNFNDRYPINPRDYRLRPVASLAASIALTAAANLGLHTLEFDEHHSLHVEPKAALQIPNADHPVATIVQQEYTETFGPYLMPYAQHFAESDAATLVDKNDISDIAERVTQARENGEKDVHIEVVGMASDEAGPLPGHTDPLHGLGETNDRNTTLAGVRGQAVANHLKEAFDEQHVTVRTLVMNGEETVLPAPRIQELRKLAGKHALSLDGMITDYNANRSLPQAITKELNASLARQRGVRVEIHGTRPVYIAPVPLVRKVEAPQAEPEQPPRPFDRTPDNFIVVPVPIATRRRQEDFLPASAISTIYERVDEKEEALV